MKKSTKLFALLLSALLVLTMALPVFAADEKGSITINNAANATAQGALPPSEANAKIAKLLELTAPKEDTQQ